MGQYFEEIPNCKSQPEKINVFLLDQSYSFYTDHGVFSKKGLDFGTRSLLERIPYDRIQGDILDFGCGYGPIGIVLKHIAKATIDMIDINERSLSLARQNAVLNHVDVTIFSSNIYTNIVKKYDFIITNPPIRVGKDILYQILRGAKNHLKQGGELWFVMHKDQGAKTVAKTLEADYHVEIVDKNKGFYVICARSN